MGAFYQNLNPGQRASLAVFLLVIIAILVAGSIWIFTPNKANLFENLDARSAAQAAQKLDEAGVAYEVLDTGDSSTIQVAQNEADKLRVTLSAELGMPGVNGLELFDNADYSMTDFSQQVAYQRAIQGELARTISEMVGIRNARIHVSLAPKTLFRADRQASKAAVYLELEQQVEPGNVNAITIQQLVSHAINDLPPENVTVFDQNGNELTASADLGSGTSIKKRVELIEFTEQKLTEQAYRLLGLLFDPRDIAVSINVKMNFDQKTERLQGLLTNENGEGVVVRSRQSQVNKAVESEQENIINTPVNTESEFEYQHGNELVETIYSTGVVEHISVGIVVSADVPEEKQAQLNALISAGLGLSQARGDTLFFTAIPSRRPSTGLSLENTTALQEGNANADTSAPAQSPAGQLGDSAQTYLSQLGSLVYVVAAIAVLFVFALIAFARSQSKVRKHAMRDLQTWLNDGAG